MTLTFIEYSADHAGYYKQEKAKQLKEGSQH